MPAVTPRKVSTMWNCSDASCHTRKSGKCVDLLFRYQLSHKLEKRQTCGSVEVPAVTQGKVATDVQGKVSDTQQAQ